MCLGFVTLLLRTQKIPLLRKGKKRLTGFVRVGSRSIHLCLFQYSVQSIICLLICLCLMIGSKDLVISFSLGAGRIN